MRLLVIHQNFPGQFKHLVQAWAKRPDWDVRGLGRDTAPGLPGFNKLQRYKLARQGRLEQHPYLRQMEHAVLHGQAVARVLLQMKRQGWTPDVILAHPGWGETLYAKDVFPDSKLIHYCEWYYGNEGTDLGFDPEFPVTFDDRARARTWNALHSLNLANCDQGVTPTRWQWSQHPKEFRDKIAIIHEGIDTEALGPNENAMFRCPDGTVLEAGDPVITYVARNLEPYRGFHIFMRALERVQQVHRTCHAVIVGGDDVSYGRKPPDARNWREQMQREVNLDSARTHFVGRISYGDYANILKISSSHVYLTYPFVLSWSLLEAVACGCRIVASDVPPVRDAFEKTQFVTLVPFFSVEQISEGIVALLNSPKKKISHQSEFAIMAKAFDVRQGQAGYQVLLEEHFKIHQQPKPSNLAEEAKII